MSRIAVFMDLQGTLGGEGTDDIRSFRFYPFTLKALNLIKENDMYAVIITNQSRISRGEFTLEEYHLYETKILNFLKAEGVSIDGIFCCPHTREDNCDCKKPKVGLINQAQESLDIDIKNSYVIGDMGCSDMILADNIGCKSILVRTGVGEGSLKEFRHTWADIEPTYIASNILDAVNWILDNK